MAGRTKAPGTLQVPELTEAQIRAVDVIVVGGTDQEAADAAGVARKTVNAWKLHNPVFISALSIRKAEIWASSGDRVRSLIPKALDRIERSMSDNKSAGGLKAAMQIVQAAMNPEASGLDFQEPSVKSPEEILEARARSNRPETDEEFMQRVSNGDMGGPVKDRELKEALEEMRELGAFEQE